MADDVEFKTNFNVEIKKLKKYIKKGNVKAMKDAMWSALEYVGNVSVQDYMIPTTINEAVSQASDNKKLSIRSGRLAGSVVGNWRFSKVDLPKTVERLVGKKIKSSTAGFEGGKTESIRRVRVSGRQFEGIIGSKVEYAKVQEAGGTLHPTNTPKAKAFFWGMFAETMVEKWKWMALSRKEKFDVPIKPRPYLQPAVDKSRPQILRIFREAIEGQGKRASDGFFERF